MARPNILFIMPDQLRADFLSCYGAEFIATPQIDSLAADGVRYARAYSTSPACVTARHNLLTGLNSIRTGVLDNSQFLRPDYREVGLSTWPELLGACGYYTAAIGKTDFYPWDAEMGFQHRVVCGDKRWLYINDDYAHFLAERDRRKMHGDEHPGYRENRGAIVSINPLECSWDYFVGQEAARFIREYDGEGPFAAMVGFPGPHCPYDPSPEYLERVDETEMPPAIPEVAGDTPRLRQITIDSYKLPWNGVDYTEFTEAHKRKIRAHYAALVMQIDDQVGGILQALRDTGRLEDTVIIFASDHGDYLGDHNLIGKGSFFEGSIHVPLIVRIPGRAGGQVIDELVALGDISPTLLQCGGSAVPDYMDFLPLPGIGLDGRGSREYLFGMMNDGWMAYDGRWKLCKYATGEHLLFDLAEDPTEQRNLLKGEGHRQVRDRLDKALTGEIMRSVVASHHDKVVYGTDLSNDLDFGEPGWERVYPKPL